MIRTLSFAVAPLLFAAAFSAAAQTNAAAPSATNAVSAGDKMPPVELREQLRTQCIAERRSVCGKILRIFPNGIRGQVLAGSAAAFVMALLSIRFLVRYFLRNRLTPFAYYCLA